MQIKPLETPDSLINAAQETSNSYKNYWVWVGPFLYVIFLSIYFVMRYHGNWAENDTAFFSSVIRNMSQEGKLLSDIGDTYPNGYAYQVISTYILAITGLDIADLQQVVYPLITPITIVSAWILYRELIGSAIGASITSILLFSQPEFLFVMMRGSHEKFTRTLIFISLYLLVHSFKVYHQRRLFISHILLFYLTAYAMIASNNLISNSFILSVAISLIVGWLLGRLKQNLHNVSTNVFQRLGLITIISIGLVFIFTFYAYPPAKYDFLILKNIWEKAASIFLDVQKTSSTSYTQIANAWISLPVYFMLSIANWLLLACSFIIWLRQSWLWILKNQSPPSRNAWLLWLFYTAFAVQGVLSILSDASGYFGNLQLRLFPSYSMIAVAIVGASIANRKPSLSLLSRTIRLGLTIGIFCVSILSIFKATNEPIFSNKWTFYQPAEIRALSWADNHLFDSEIGTDFDERLAAAFTIVTNYTGNISSNGNILREYNTRSTVRVYLVTDVTRLRISRLQSFIPIQSNSLQIYDAGTAQLFRLHPQTPYQK